MTEFEELMAKRDEDYKGGYYKLSINWATKAIEAARNKEEIVLALLKRGWGRRFVGYKTHDLVEREEMYTEAKYDWLFVLEDRPKNIDVVISAIKGLMLLPVNSEETVEVEIEGMVLTLNKEIVELYQTGEREIKERVSGQDAQNMKAELLNSLGLVVRSSDLITAENIFGLAFGISKSGITITGNAMQNAATCRLILKDAAENPEEKRNHAMIAIKRLKIALEPQGYPEEEIEHRRNCQKKIDNTREEIKNNFK